MLQGEHSAILLIFIKLPFVFKTFVLSVFEWPLKTGFTVHEFSFPEPGVRVIPTCIIALKNCSFLTLFIYSQTSIIQVPGTAGILLNNR